MKQRLKKIILAISATGMVLGFGSVAFAKGGGHHGQRGAHMGKMMEKLDGMSEPERLEFLEDRLDKRVERMTEKLELNADQQVKVRQVLADSQTQLLQIWEANKNVDDKTVARAEAKSVMKQSHQDIQGLLTAEQKAKVEAHREERHGDRKAKMIQRLDSKLDLSDVQQAKIEKILDDAHADLKASRGTTDSPDNMRGAHRQVFQNARAEINDVLTADQQVEFAKIQEQMKQRRGKGMKNRRQNGKRGGF